MLEKKLDSLSRNKGLLLAFIVGFAVRLIPELLSFPSPIGWDTIYYAYRIEEGVLFGFWDNVFSSWMIYAILIFLRDLTSLEPFMLLKIVAPILYGGASAGIYFVAWKKLKWSATKSLLACVVFVFSLASLAISWQFYRNLFGVMVLLFVLPFIKTAPPVTKTFFQQKNHHLQCILYWQDLQGLFHQSPSGSSTKALVGQRQSIPVSFRAANV